MKIGLFAGPSLMPRLLLERVNALVPGSGHLFDLSLSSGHLSLDADEIFWDGMALTHFNRVWLHGFSYANPVIPISTPQRDWSVWHYDYLTSQQEYSTLFSLFEELDRRGVSVFNPPGVHVRHFMKFALLEELRASGFQIPPLLCSNDKKCADLFYRERSTVVWRPVTGRAAWQLFTEKQCADLIDPGKPPILLAEGMPGPLMRAYLLAGNPILCLQQNHPEHTPPVERLEQFLPVSCTDHSVVLRRLVQKLGLSWAVVTFIPSATGPWIYDLDPDPLLDWLPVDFRDFLLDALAGELTGHAQTMAEPQLRQERPTMFLRRMLKVLFELEYSKYKP